VFYDDIPEHAWEKIIKEYNIAPFIPTTIMNPYAKRDEPKLKNLLAKHDITFKTYKDQVIFEKAR
jgi:deoxyribodipyrimidine photo-lyase